MKTTGYLAYAIYNLDDGAVYDEDYVSKFAYKEVKVEL